MTESVDKSSPRAHRFAEGAVGAGIVLVLLPSMVLVWKLKEFRDNPTIGYPILAIFGIMILLGALALVSTLFSRLKLSSPRDALALPPGSIRATIALSLIVLFALLSVMLYQSLSAPEPATLRGLNESAKQRLVSDPSMGVMQVTPIPCPAATAAAAGSTPAAASPVGSTDACPPGALFKYDVQIGHAPSGPAIDFAKQLLTLIGGLMTSVVSFYFAAKSTEMATAKAMEAVKAQAAPIAKATPQPSPDDGDHEHGGVTSPTDDKDLPQAQGGVAKGTPDEPVAA